MDFLGKKKLIELGKYVLAESRATQTEVSLAVGKMGLTRFANNRIHQNMIREDRGLSIRVVLGKKIGVARSEGFEKSELKETLEEALELAKSQEEDESFVSLPGPSEGDFAEAENFSLATANFSPANRAEVVARALEKAKGAGLTAYGALTTGVSEQAVVNSLGIEAYTNSTTASFNTTMMKGRAAGYGGCLGTEVTALDFDKEIDRAIGRVRGGEELRKVAAGEYEVILAPEAVNELLLYLAYLGFGARAYHEGRSFLSGKKGEKLFSEKITIIDDSLDGRGLPAFFDFEGVRKKELALVREGKAVGVAYDSYLAKKYGEENTGHGLPAPNTLDAICGHLKLLPGRGGSEEAMIGKVKQGVYVARFWYVNCHHHKNLELTGLTRDGTFWIENGKISYPMVNLRFTQGVPEALRAVISVGSKQKAVESWLGANLVPALHLGKWRFTGVSQL